MIVPQQIAPEVPFHILGNTENFLASRSTCEKHLEKLTSAHIATAEKPLYRSFS